jgi:hypothetical protein
MHPHLQTTIYVRHDKFFRERLLISNSDDINQLVESMETECQQIKTEAIRFSWYMRGGLTYDQALALSHSDRQIISNLIKENLETTKKSGLPFF